MISASTTCSASVQNEDPFPVGDSYPGDTVGVCTINTSDIPSGSIRTNYCSYPSIVPGSDPKDCTNYVGGGFITIVKDADPDDSTVFNFTVDSRSYSITGSGTVGVGVAPGQTYSVTETIPANWGLVSASCVDVDTGLSVGTFDGIDSVSGLAMSTGDDYECTFSNRAVADLALAKSVSSPTVDEGGVLTYTLQLTNNGPATATNINVNDVVPAGLSYVPGSISGGNSRTDGSPAGSGLSWVVNTLASGSSTSLQFQVTADAGTGGTTITNTATKTQDQIDTDTTADTPAVDVSVNNNTDLVMIKTVDAALAAVGDTVTYTLTLTNNGPAQATNVSVTDALPVGVSYSSDVPSQGSYDSGSGIWSVGGLAMNGTATLTIQVVPDSGTEGTTITNTVTAVTLDQTDTNATPDLLSVDITVANPVLTLDKQIVSGDPYATVGEVLSYEYLVTNTGNVGITGLSVSDDRIASVSCGVTDLNPAESVTCTGSYAVTQADLDAGSVTNNASATGTPAGGSLVDPTDSVTVSANQAPGLSLVVSSATADYSAVGDAIDYSYAVSNSGKVLLAGPVVIADDTATASCPALSTVGNGDGNLDPGGPRMVPPAHIR